MLTKQSENCTHCRININVVRRAGNQLEDGPYEVLTSDMRVKNQSTGSYTYPDIVAVCDQPQFEDEEQDTLLNPRTIVEILSDSSEKYDRGIKFMHYREIPSILECVLIAHDGSLVEQYVRQGEKSWNCRYFNRMDDVLVFASLPVRISLTEIYDRVVFAT